MKLPLPYELRLMVYKIFKQELRVLMKRQVMVKLLVNLKFPVEDTAYVYSNYWVEYGQVYWFICGRHEWKICYDNNVLVDGAVQYKHASGRTRNVHYFPQI